MHDGKDGSDGNQRLRAVLAEVGWGPEAFARRITAHAGRQRLKVIVHDKTPYQWLRSGSCPRDPIPRLAAGVLSECLGREVAPADLGWQVTQVGIRRADDGFGDMWLPDKAVRCLEEVASSMERRGFLALSGAALTAVAHQWMVFDLDRLAAVLDGHQVDETLVVEFERLADARRRMDDALGGGAMYESVTADLRLVTQLLSNATYPDALGRRLYAVAAEFARMAGWACHENGQEGAAQRYWLAALRASHEAEDTALGAHILMFMATQNTAIGDPQDSVTLCASARQTGGAALGATQRAAIAGREAEAHARAGNAYATAKHVEESFAFFGQADPETDPAWLYWVGKAEISGGAGNAYFHLGDLSAAVPHLRTAMDAFDASCVRDRTSKMIRLAMTYLRAGDADQALALGHEVVDMAARLTSNRLRDKLGEFCQEAAAMKIPAVSDLDDHIHTALKAT